PLGRAGTRRHDRSPQCTGAGHDIHNVVAVVISSAPLPVNPSFARYRSSPIVRFGAMSRWPGFFYPPASTPSEGRRMLRYATAPRANEVPRVPGFTEDHLPHTILHPSQFRDIWNGEGHSPERELAAAVLDAAASDLRNFRYARRRRRQRMYWQTYQWVASD